MQQPSQTATRFIAQINISLGRATTNFACYCSFCAACAHLNHSRSSSRSFRPANRCARLAKRSRWGDFRARRHRRNFGLCATILRKPRQARKGATVADQLRVPRSTRSSFYLDAPIGKPRGQGSDSWEDGIGRRMRRTTEHRPDRGRF